MQVYFLRMWRHPHGQWRFAKFNRPIFLAPNASREESFSGHTCCIILTRRIAAYTQVRECLHIIFHKGIVQHPIGALIMTPCCILRTLHFQAGYAPAHNVRGPESTCGPWSQVDSRPRRCENAAVCDTGLLFLCLIRRMAPVNLVNKQGALRTYSNLELHGNKLICLFDNLKKFHGKKLICLFDNWKKFDQWKLCGFSTCS